MEEGVGFGVTVVVFDPAHENFARWDIDPEPPADGCYDVYVNGVRGPYYNTNFLAPSFTFNVVVVPKNILFTWDAPKKNDRYTLPADGTSKATPSTTDSSVGALTWSIEGPTLGASINTTSGVLTAGTKAGTIRVKASTGSICYKKEIDFSDCAAGGCQDNQCGTEAGTLQTETGNIGGGIDARFPLGWARQGNTAGFMQIKETAPSADLATPAKLQYNFLRSGLDVITNSSGLRQVRMPDGLANIVTITNNQYKIDFYHPTNVLGMAGAGTLYGVTNSPFATVTIENPGGDTNKLRLTHTRDGISTIHEYTWLTNVWQLSQASGLRQEIQTTVWSDTNTLRTVTTQVTNSANGMAFQKIEKYRTNSVLQGERLEQEITGTGSTALTNTYTWLTNGYLQQVVRSDGSWAYYQYDSSNRPTNIFSGFKSQGVTTNKSLCRVSELVYSTNVISGAGDTGYLETSRARQIVEYVLGQEVRRSYYVALPGERHEIRCVDPGATWNNANNLVTITKLFTNGFYLNESMSILRPDNTIDIFIYPVISTTNATFTNTVLSGHVDSSGTNIDRGRKTFLAYGSNGLMTSKTVIDVESGITVAQETYLYDGLKRPTTRTFLDGTSVATTYYDCCLARAVTERDGTVIAYTNDALKRLITTTINSITTSNVLDAVGHALKTVRIGNDGSQMTLSRDAYDLAGRQIEHTNAVNARTGTSYSADALTTTTTYDDGSTRIESHFLDGRLQSITGTAVHGARHEFGVVSDGGTNRLYDAEIKLKADGSDMAETVTNFFDMVGRVYKTAYAGASSSPAVLSYFNTRGQLTNQIDPDGVSTLFIYDAAGELTHTIVDMNTNGVMDFSGADRITMVTNDVASDNGSNVRRTRTYVWGTSADSSTLVSTEETSVDGLKSWNIVWNNGVAVTSSNVTTIDTANARRVVTSYSPDGSYVVSTNKNGQLISVTRRDSSGAQIGQNVYGYDAHGRQTTNTDARTGATTYSFDNADQNTGMTTPTVGSISQVTSNFFDSLGRIWKVGLPDSTFVTNVFSPAGDLVQTSGSRTYPTGYRRDDQGRLTGMTNWTTFLSTGARVTSWTNDPYRGFIVNKVYPDNNGTTYTYTPAGRLKTRTWARGIVTTNAYNAAGEFGTVTYSDGSTSSILYGYDRRGRATAITNGATVCTLAFNDAGQLLSESYSGGPLDGASITNGYDAFLRRIKQVTLLNGAVLTTSTNGFDAASRLQVVSDGTNSANYTYLANSPLVSALTFKQSSTTRLTASMAFDNLNRLYALTNTPSGDSALSFNYAYNSANQRTAITNQDNSRWAFQNDSLGQVTSGKKYWSDGMPVAGQQFEYAFDDSGNRKYAASGGDQWGANLRYENYTVNSLNQYTQRTIPGSLDVIGAATNTATVTVNNQATYRKGDYFRANYPVNNSTGAVWLSLTNIAVLQRGTNSDLLTNNTGNAFVPQSPENFGFDADGNQTNDGRWALTWDARNRLVGISSLSGPTASKRKLDFTYDYFGRRIQKVVSTNNGSTYIGQYTNKFVYDGWNLVAIFDGSTNLLYSYRWGTDASGTLQGAGGVGGLVSMTVHGGTLAGVYFYCFDGNHNVLALASAADGTLTAQFDYGPFGQPLRATGPLAFPNPFRFSTKFQDDEIGFLCYGFRYYNPFTGRWLSRDPLGEEGGPNLNGFLGNDGINFSDPYGLFTFGEWTSIVGQGFVGAWQGVENVGGAAWSLVKSPYTLTKGLSQAAGTLSTKYGWEQVGRRLELAYQLAEKYANDPCFAQRMNKLLGDKAKDYFTDPQKLSELLANVAVGAATAGLGAAAEAGKFEGVLAKLGELFQDVDVGAGAAEGGTVRAFSSAGTTGSGSISLDEALAAAQRNGIDTRMFKLEYGGAAPRYFGSSSFTPTDLTLQSFKIARAPDGRAIITLFDNGLSSQQAAVETIAHEINHIRGVFQSGTITSEEAAEAAARAAGQHFR